MEDDELELFFPATEEDEAILAAIGHVASAWARFEFVLNSDMALIGDIRDDVAECLTSQIGSIGLRLDAYTAICHLKGCSAELLKDINKFREEEVIPLSLKRNRIVHDPWMSGVQTGKPYRLEVTARKRLVSEFKPYSVDSIKAVAKAIEEMTWRFTELNFRALQERRSPSPKTPPSEPQP